MICWLLAINTQVQGIGISVATFSPKVLFEFGKKEKIMCASLSENF